MQLPPLPTATSPIIQQQPQQQQSSSSVPTLTTSTSSSGVTGPAATTPTTPTTPTLPSPTTGSSNVGSSAASVDYGVDASGKGFGKVMSDLSKKLARRQGPEELVQRNILREDELTPTVSNTIIQQKMALEAEKQKDALNRKIAMRPSKVDLKLRNILRVDSMDSIDQSGQSIERTPDMEERKQALRSCLKKRPEKGQLEEMNIIKGGSLDPSLIATQEKLRRSQISDTLQKHIISRPDPDQLAEQKILVFSETVEVLPTFRKTEYNRKPDNNATFKKLTPQMKVAIREELNSYKKHEMSVHEQSLRNTCFH